MLAASGARLAGWAFQRVLNSSDLFFLTRMARRKGHCYGKMGPDAGDPLFGQGQQQLESQDADGDAQDAVDEYDLPQGAQVFFPQAFFGGCGLRCLGVAVQEAENPTG